MAVLNAFAIRPRLVLHLSSIRSSVPTFSIRRYNAKSISKVSIREVVFREANDGVAIYA